MNENEMWYAVLHRENFAMIGHDVNKRHRTYIEHCQREPKQSY